jgi:nucleoid DNA-binding protein
MTKAQLVDAVASKAGITKRAATVAVNVVLEEMHKALEKEAPGSSRSIMTKSGAFRRKGWPL